MLDYQIYKPLRAIKSAVFMFHGWGQDEREMQKFFPLFGDKHLLIALKAPYWREKPKGYSWFTMKDRVRDAFMGDDAENTRLNQLMPAMKAEEIIIAQTITHIQQKYDIENMHFIGFSQGAMMALYMGLIMEAQNIISIAGYGAMELLDEITDINSRILLLTGDKDRIVPPFYQKQLYNYFQQRNADVNLEIIKNIGHIPLSGELMKLARDFIS